jgi:hypothetical protein
LSWRSFGQGRSRAFSCPNFLHSVSFFSTFFFPSFFTKVKGKDQKVAMTRARNPTLSPELPGESLLR